MPTTITLKNIPHGLYELIKQNAAENRRSINNEVVSIIENALRSQKIDPEDFLATVRKLRERTNRIQLTNDLTYKAKNEGRP